MNSEIALRDDSLSVDLARGWTPAALRAQIAQEKELRSIIIEYYQSCMVEGHHYYRLDGDEKKKPALTKEGALALCHLFRSHPHPGLPVETWSPDGHYGVRSSVSIIERASGDILAEGVGYCSTRESKYAYRQGTRICPQCGKAAIIKGKEEYGGGWLCFRKKDGCGAKFKDGDTEIESQPTGRIPNEDLPDQYNTALKMSHKRATVDAALAMPLVSEIFTQDLEEQIIEERSKALAGGAVVEHSRQPEPQIVHEKAGPPAVKGPAKPMKEEPTKTAVMKLFQRMQEVYGDAAVVTGLIRAVVQPVGETWSDFRVRNTITGAHFQQLTADTERDATQKADETNANPPDDDVPLTLGQESRDEPIAQTLPQGEGTESGDTSTSIIEEASVDAEALPDDSHDASDPPEVEVGPDGLVVQSGMTILWARADRNDKRALVDKIQGSAPGLSLGQFRYAWVEVGPKKAKVKL